VKVLSACPLDCPDACSLEVTVENGRVVKLVGASDRNPVTEGYICAKVRKFPEHLYGKERLLQPMLRVGNKGEGVFEPLTWQQAISLLAKRLVETRDRFGGEAILPYSYGGSNGYLTQDTTDALLFHRLGASRLARTVCAAATGRAATGLYGKMEGVAIPDYPASRLIVVWGCNPSASGIHIVPPIQAAIGAGAKLVVIDPRATPLAKQADLHLALRPGTDLVVALAVIRELFATGRADREFLARHTTRSDELERRAAPWTLARAAAVAEIPLADLERFVELYASISPAVVRCGWGVERNRNGGSAVAAILALPAVAGKFGVRGGGYTMSNTAAFKMSAAAISGPEAPTRTINMNRLGAALTTTTDRPIHLLFVYNSNALMTTPNQTLVREGLAREDLFTVVFDQVLTDTARYADLVLPATTFLEHRELSRGYGAYVLQSIAPVVQPYREARSNYSVFADLALRTGVAQPGEIPDEETAIQQILESSGEGPALRAAMATHGFARPAGGDRPIQFVDVFPRTEDRKVHLVPVALDAEAREGLYAYQPDPGSERAPLALVSPSTNRTISSTLGQLRKGPVPLEMHPHDATARGLINGQRVRVANDYGAVICHLRVSADMRPGVVELPKGLWAQNTENGATANALAPDTLTDLGGSACFNDARVEVSPA
jgi:anaerobic selenocysteine-containing dehydrogenase